MNEFEEFLVKKAATIQLKEPRKQKGEVAWESPSNIAIVKYWGKYPSQIPANASFSITLSKALTRTRISYEYRENAGGPSLDFEFKGQQQSGFSERIENFLKSIEVFIPWIGSLDLSIRSENTFPHSSGIASSASAMSALSIGLCEIEEQLFGKTEGDDFLRKASFMSRLGSGSAARSLYGKMAVWGITASCEGSSDEYAIPVEEIHPDFERMKDSILIIESGKKQVSSSLGHDLMRSNPYAKLRFEAAELNMQKMCSVIREGNVGEFIDIMENEALSLHAMMMTSMPGFLLLKPNTLEALGRIRNFRNTTGKAIGFTLDAGANVHVIYPENQAAAIRDFIETELKELCENEHIIHDEMGNGPCRVEKV
ncbi:MAG: hypothetical protein K9J30_13755 [Bacteroidales bacterium]|nr:hypothetical protein [Bacteroidales bacterium]